MLVQWTAFAASTADIEKNFSKSKKRSKAEPEPAMRNTLQEEKLKDKCEAGGKDMIEEPAQQILEKNQLAQNDKLEAKQKELEGMVTRIAMKVYQAAGRAGGMPGEGMPGGSTHSSGTGSPTLDEVD